MISQKTLENAHQAHRTNLLKSLEHRLEVAKANGQKALVEQLEAERRYYAN